MKQATDGANAFPFKMKVREPKYECGWENIKVLACAFQRNSGVDARFEMHPFRSWSRESFPTSGAGLPWENQEPGGGDQQDLFSGHTISTHICYHNMYPVSFGHGLINY